MLLADIKSLHVELSSKCNAWCPSCPRSKNGYGIKDGLVPQNLVVDKLRDAINALPNLTKVQFCGRYGDPAIHPELNEILDWVIPKVKQITIHTNGSMRNTEWWAEMGRKLSKTDHRVWFGIDGLAGVHEIYRQGTEFDKVIENATAFINAGGNAVWQFIPFKHNEHQLNACIKLANQLKFTDFELVEGVRNVETARNYRTGDEYKLEPWTHDKTFNFRVNQERKLSTKNCAHLEAPGLYITASGKYTLCCHFDPFDDRFEPIGFDTIEETQQLDIAAEINTQPRPLCVFACAGLKMDRKLIPLTKLRKSNEH
jgi:MoaA/NifB/PqqE/SkfB family radical SAM enzyme